MPALHSTVVDSAKECGIPFSRILIFNPNDEVCPEGFDTWQTLLQHAESDWNRFESEQEAQETTACLLSTSGTTGLPKLAMITHANCVARSAVLAEYAEKKYKINRLVFLPMFHAFAWPLAVTIPLREGHTTYVMPRFDMEQFLNAVETLEITETAMVPPIVLACLKNSSSKMSLRDLQLLWCAGAPLARSSIVQMYEILSPTARVAQAWGLTECGWITTFPHCEKDDSGSVGRLLPNTEAKLVDSQGVDIPETNCTSQIGEAYVRSPMIMKGYLGDYRATQDAFEKAWYKTGDITYHDRGKWFIVDRAKDLIKVRGWSVAPSELEAVLLSHPHIHDAAVIGVNYGGDELPLAFLVRDIDSLSETEVNLYLETRLARYKRLDGGIRFVTSIPKNTSGKVLRAELRASLQAESQA
ncbi:hypothetical protein MMC25_007841 [Agyrium rufum]|nr:hypothetical protein [Agyrium rufum]